MIVYHFQRDYATIFQETCPILRMKIVRITNVFVPNHIHFVVMSELDKALAERYELIAKEKDLEKL